MDQSSEIFATLSEDKKKIGMGRSHISFFYKNFPNKSDF